MSKKIWLALILILTVSAVAVVTFTITQNRMPQGNDAQSKQSNDTANSTTSTEAKLEGFMKDMSPYTGGHDDTVRRELLFMLQVFERLEPADERLIIGLKPDDIANHPLVELQCVRSFLGSYSNPQSVNAYAFTSERYRPFFNSLTGDSNLTPERVIAARKRIRQVAEGFVTLRKKAISLPYIEADNRLHFLEMLQDLASENYSDAKIMSEPVLPLFNDREGRLISLVEKWLNSSHAQKAIPIEQFERLYREGKIQVLGPSFGSYLNRIKARINEERDKAKESQKTEYEQLSRVYSDIETFFETLGQLSAP